MSEIRILICDDHALVRAGLCRLLELEPDLVVVGEAADAEAATERTAALRPDVVLLDVVLPGRSGIDAVPEILRSAHLCGKMNTGHAAKVRCAQRRR